MCREILLPIARNFGDMIHHAYVQTQGMRVPEGCNHGFDHQERKGTSACDGHRARTRDNTCTTTSKCPLGSRSRSPRQPHTFGAPPGAAWPSFATQAAKVGATWVEAQAEAAGPYP